ncbi:NUDIX domain-containing protein [Candidatus Parcubacteria bacterium]|nr:NUDIX domain-containing protein [Patescibacteria group bacterium]MBU4466617.1 NUDIX domain-containing protein [Patescibacteria group bacterium]MCG2688357.1 NUDIX domain-containing protein [Candidatus Parcubacteria bacterium]
METRVTQKAIILNSEGKVLSLHRSSTDPTSPNKWDLPGGEIDFGEDAFNALIREVNEECGLSVKDIKPFDVESHKNDKGEFWVTIAYIVKTKSDDIKLSFEHDEFRWLSPKEFLELESTNKIRRFINNLARSGNRDT